MSRDTDVLHTLAEQLNVTATMNKHGLKKPELKALLLRAASLMEEIEKAEHETTGGAALRIFTDGASRGNPGPAGAGFAIYDQDKLVEAQGQYLGKMTNNQAEYHALIMALTRAIELGASVVAVSSDSELMVRQIKGEYKVKNPGLKKLFAQARELIREFESFEINHVPREKNAQADRMANRAIDEFQND